MHYQHTQAAKLERIAEFERNMAKAGFRVCFSKDGNILGIKKRQVKINYQSHLIHGAKADYSPLYFKVSGDFILAKSNQKAVDTVCF